MNPRINNTIERIRNRFSSNVGSRGAVRIATRMNETAETSVKRSPVLKPQPKAPVSIAKKKKLKKMLLLPPLSAMSARYHATSSQCMMLMGMRSLRVSDRIKNAIL